MNIGYFSPLGCFFLLPWLWFWIGRVGSPGWSRMHIAVSIYIGGGSGLLRNFDSSCHNLDI